MWRRPGGIDEYDIVAVLLSVLDTCFCDLDRGHVGTLGINRDIKLFADDLELFYCSRAVDVAGDEKRASARFLKAPASFPQWVVLPAP